jgi:hypothetical protein
MVLLGFWTMSIVGDYTYTRNQRFGNRSSFHNDVFSSTYVEFRTMDKVQKPSNSEGYRTGRLTVGRSRNITLTLSLSRVKCLSGNADMGLNLSIFTLSLPGGGEASERSLYSPFMWGECGLQDRLISTRAAVHSSMKSSCEELGRRLRDLKQSINTHHTSDLRLYS